MSVVTTATAGREDERPDRPGDVIPRSIKQLKRLKPVIFPVSYNDKFYKDVLEVGELAKLGMIMVFLFCSFSRCTHGLWKVPRVGIQPMPLQ